MLIPKTDGDFAPATARTISVSLRNMRGKIFLTVVVRRLTEFMINDKYVVMSVLKGDLPTVNFKNKGCIEVIEDARLNRRDLNLVWPDFANAYGALPHLLHSDLEGLTVL